MKRFVFEFTNEENDRATEEFYLLKNVETVKSDCKTLCCVFAMMPLLLVFLYIIDSVREEAVAEKRMPKSMQSAPSRMSLY